VTKDNHFLKFDAQGNSSIVEALKTDCDAHYSCRRPFNHFPSTATFDECTIPA
jgi:hypothetical protein